jgi:ubiquinone/menaquinone biosynthesis C-methylase UbiE
MRTNRWGSASRPNDDEPVVNPFLTEDVAERYARARPDLHGRVISEIAPALPAVRRVLDLAAGTGLSTVAAASLGAPTVGADASFAMVSRAAAAAASGAALVVSRAERSPFRDATFDLVTVASAIHWFELPALDELARVTAADASLVVYDVWFRGEMVGEPAFGAWMRSEVSARYPRVAKREFERRDLERVGFRPRTTIDLALEVRMDLEAVVDYLQTHSERITAIDRGMETTSEQASFLREGIRPFYANAVERDLRFGADVEIFGRSPRGRS